MNEKFKGAREWKDEFYFLEKTGLEPLYSMLLGMAQSKSDIRRFNDLLDPRVKLMRSHLIKLESFWQKYVGVEKKTIARKQRSLNDETLRWLFANACGENNNTKLYFDYLIIEKSNHIPPLPFPNALRLVTGSPRGYDFWGIYGIYFFANIFDSVFEIEFVVSEDGKSIFVCLLVCEKYLTEELAHRLGQVPDCDVFESIHRSEKRGRCISLTYCLPTIDLDSHLDKGHNKFSDMDVYISNDKFLNILKIKLVEMGLPVDRLSTGDGKKF